MAGSAAASEMVKLQPRHNLDGCSRGRKDSRREETVNNVVFTEQGVRTRYLSDQRRKRSREGGREVMSGVRSGTVGAPSLLFIRGKIFFVFPYYYSLLANQ